MNPDDLPPEKESWWWTVGGKWTLVGLTLVLLVIAFYAEENWRGEAAWNQAKADIAAAGESIDANKFIPPPIPEDQNFGALPIFRLEPDSGGVAPAFSLIAGPMNRALARVEKIPYSPTDNQGPDQLPYLGHWDKDETSDVPAIRKRLVELCRKNSLPVSDTMSLPEMFGLLCPALADLRTANANHPLCQFIHDDMNRLPFERALSGVVSQIKLAKVLSYQEQLALLDHQPQLALDDLEVEWKINSGLCKEPSLVAGLVSVGVVAIQLGVIEQGLATHVWDDRQLVELDHDLAQIDDLKDNQLCVRSEVAVFSIPTIDYLKKHRLEMRALIIGGYGMPSSAPPSLSEQAWDMVGSCLMVLIPNGWFDSYKADSTRARLLGSLKVVDPGAHRAFPEKEQAAVRLIQSTNETSYWRDFVERISEGTLHTGKRFAYAQMRVDEARIACQLERYRLVHGEYPNALADLAPAQIPNDVMNGQPYHYERQNDGTYLLYSVAWNQIDDKGRGGGTASNHYYLDDPDWVWTNHPHVEKTK